MKKDDFFLITHGEYDEYTVYGLYRAKQDYDLERLRREYIQSFPEANDGTLTHRVRQPALFIEYLEQRDLAEKVQCHELEVERPWPPSLYGGREFRLIYTEVEP